MEKTEKTFEVLASKRAAFETQMARLMRKAAKLGVEAPSYTMGEPAFVERSTVRSDGRTYKYLVEVIPTTVTSVVVRLPGWTFLATLEHLEGGETLLRATTDEPLPAEYRTATPKCDHCKLDRKRRDTYLVRSDAGQIVQIGRSCIADFLGHPDPEHLARLAEYAADAMGWDDYCEGGGGEEIAETLDFVTVTMALVRLKGFVGKKLAEETMRSTTAADVFKVIFPYEGSREEKKFSEEVKAEVTGSDKQKAQAAIDWILGLEGELNDFLHNVRAVVRQGGVKHRTKGYAAALSVAHARAMDDLKKRAERPVSKHQGVIGERGVFTLTIGKILPIETHYGMSYLHLMTDAEGNDFKWFASGSTLYLPEPGRDAEEGDTVTIKATVKNHEEYKGRAQTGLSRCALYTPPVPKVKKPRAKKAVEPSL